MIIVLQRTSQAHVAVNKNVISEIKKGLVLLVGVYKGDDFLDADKAVDKIINLRIFSDQDGKMNLSVSDIQGEILVVSQFTLHAGTKKGNRPSFIKAGKPEFAKTMYEQFIVEMKKASGLNVAAGIFGAEMKVSLLNDGPVTIWMDSKNKE